MGSFFKRETASAMSRVSSLVRASTVGRELGLRVAWGLRTTSAGAMASAGVNALGLRVASGWRTTSALWTASVVAMATWTTRLQDCSLRAQRTQADLLSTSRRCHCDELG